MSESLITKKALSTGLKEIMKHKGFDKITVADITKQCGLNRQTFYYHFQDKYDLINWIYYNEAFIVLSDQLTFDNWNDKILEMLTVIKREAYFYENALKSSGSDEFERYFLSFTKELFRNIIKRLDDKNIVSDDDLEFFTQFFSFGCVGFIVSWAKTGMNSTPENIIKHVKNLVNDSRMFAVKRYFEQK